MVTHCHRCGGVLDEDATFCPHCAAPQLRVAPQEEITEQAAGPVHAFTRDRRSVDWRSAIRLAIWTAIPVGLIAPFFFPMVIAGPIVLIAIYQRRRPAASLDGKAGFRIGALMGMLTAYVSAFGVGVWQLFEHYSRRQESALDTVIALQLQQAAEATQRMAQANSLDAQQVRAMLDFFLSPDARVAYTFFNAAVMAIGIIVLAGLGGMLGARLIRRSATQ
jgi:ribosomal protein L40E